jgi:hypothetical protein
MGQISNYTFTNVTEPHTIQVISNKLTYPITVLVDEHSIISPKSVIITYGESQSFSISADSGYQVSHVYIDGVDKGKTASYTFTNVQGNHTISVASEPINSSPTPTLTPSVPETSPSPTPTTSTIENSASSQEPLVILAVAIVIVIAFFGLALKKGYIQIELVDDEKEENS